VPSAAGGSNRCREAEAGTPEDNVGEGAEASVLVAVMAALVPIGGVASMVATPLHRSGSKNQVLLADARPCGAAPSALTPLFSRAGNRLWTAIAVPLLRCRGFDDRGHGRCPTLRPWSCWSKTWHCKFLRWRGSLQMPRLSSYRRVACPRRNRAEEPVLAFVNRH
jgi:hypothetical protein